MALNHFVEFLYVSLFQCASELMELQHIVSLEHLTFWHVAQQHFHWHQIDQNQAVKEEREFNS